MNLIGLPIAKKFRPLSGRSYFCDNYTLNFGSTSSRWRIILNNREIINDSHPDFWSMMDCFKWRAQPVNDEIIVNDREEQADMEFRNLSEFLATYKFDREEREEIKEAIRIASREPGFYSGFTREKNRETLPTWEDLYQ